MNLHPFLSPNPRRHEQDKLVWLTPTLAVGGAAAARSPRRLAAAGIGAVLDLQQETRDQSERLKSRGIAYFKVPVRDFGAPEPEDFGPATDWVLSGMAAGAPVLIQCRAGLGRSIVFAIATLLRVGYPLPDAYNLIRRLQPELMLSDRQAQALRQFAGSL